MVANIILVQLYKIITNSIQMVYLQIISDLDIFAEHKIRKSLEYFNASETRAQELADMLLPNRKGVSLRLADHLVVQYSRDKDIMIPDINSDGPPIQLWHDYRRTLVVETKKFFDVFKRKNSIKAILLDETIDTTVGQIVFLCWYCERNLVEYMTFHEIEVRKHMQQIEQKSRKRVKTDSVKIRKKRAASRSESVKPTSNQYFGNFKMSL